MLSSGKYLYQNLSAVTWICDLTVHADVGTCWRNPRYQRRPPPPPIIDSSTPQQPPSAAPLSHPSFIYMRRPRWMVGITEWNHSRLASQMSHLTWQWTKFSILPIILKEFKLKKAWLFISFEDTGNLVVTGKAIVRNDESWEVWVMLKIQLGWA